MKSLRLLTFGLMASASLLQGAGPAEEAVSSQHHEYSGDNLVINPNAEKPEKRFSFLYNLVTGSSKSLKNKDNTALPVTIELLTRLSDALQKNKFLQQQHAAMLTQQKTPVTKTATTSQAEVAGLEKSLEDIEEKIDGLDAKLDHIEARVQDKSTADQVAAVAAQVENVEEALGINIPPYNGNNDE